MIVNGRRNVDFVGEGVRNIGKQKRTWKEVVDGDIKSLKLSKEVDIQA